MWATLQKLVYIHKLLVATFDHTSIAFYPFNKRNIRCRLIILGNFLLAHTYLFTAGT